MDQPTSIREVKFLRAAFQTMTKSFIKTSEHPITKRNKNKKNKKKMFRLTIILILLSVYTEQASGGSIFLYNQVRHGILMKVHCKSGDSDMGWHVRKYGGNYGFDFKDHILDKTLYWCNVWSGPNFSRNASFVAYEGKQYKNRSNWIRWSIRGDGIYESIDGATPWKFKYHWFGTPL